MPVLNYFIQGKSYPYPSRDELSEVMPQLKKKFLRYASYANATIDEVFTPEQMKGMKELKVQQLKNCILENVGNSKLLLKELPLEAQMSPVFGASIEDINGDRKNDIILTGNFYPFRVQLGREDASYGTILSGVGSKSFASLPFNKTGWFTSGDIRDMVSVKTKSGKTLYIIAKNNDRLQVVKRN
jgi:hypothetical protein